jgi:pantothenate kinase-related protein Tda10
MSVPSLQEETVSVKVVPDAAITAKEQPVAVPALEKSAFATESTDCANAIEKVIGEVVFVGDVVAEENVVGVENVRYLKTTIPEPPLAPEL